MKGLSRANLFYMRAFAEAYPSEQIVQQLAGQIPRFHSSILFELILILRRSLLNVFLIVVPIQRELDPEVNEKRKQFCEIMAAIYLKKSGRTQELCSSLLHKFHVFLTAFAGCFKRPDLLCAG
jgi:hypothetical protein